MASTPYDYAYTFTAKAEGGYSNDKYDRGGATGYGVSTALLKSMSQISRDRNFLESCGVLLPVSGETIKSLTREQAKEIFKSEFWDKNDLGIYPVRMAAVLFDMAVNHGWKNAVKIAQRGYNSFVGVYGSKLVVDGIDGHQTRQALKGDADLLLTRIIDRRWDFYEAIMENNPTQEKFRNGWHARCQNLRKYLGVK